QEQTRNQNEHERPLRDCPRHGIASVVGVALWNRLTTRLRGRAASHRGAPHHRRLLRRVTKTPCETCSRTHDFISASFTRLVPPSKSPTRQPLRGAGRGFCLTGPRRSRRESAKQTSCFSRASLLEQLDRTPGAHLFHCRFLFFQSIEEPL